jgi:hypothetical protein
MSTTTPNMILTTPESGDTDYPTSISDSFDAIDDHDHSTGKGVQIVSGGIADLAVTTAKLAANAVTTAKITDANVTRAKLAAVGQQISSSTGASQQTQSASYVDVTNATVTITTTGRPVVVCLVPAADGSGNISSVAALAAAGDFIEPEAVFKLLRDSTNIGEFYLSVLAETDDGLTKPARIRVPPGLIHTLDTPSAGTYVYKLQYKSNDGIALADVTRCKLVAYEL